MLGPPLLCRAPALLIGAARDRRRAAPGAPTLRIQTAVLFAFPGHQQRNPRSPKPSVFAISGA